MKYVLDSSVGLKWVLVEPDSAEALQLRANYRSLVHELISPDFFPIEVAHALTRAERQRRIPSGTGWGLWQKVILDRPAMLPWQPLMARGFELSSKMRVGIYDCLYIALAEQEQCRVVTGDQRLQNAFPNLTISLASLP